MEVKDIIYGLRVKKGLSQDALARKVMVSRRCPVGRMVRQFLIQKL